MSTLSERIPSNPNLPFEVRQVFATAKEPEGLERNTIVLWREVVARLIMDALGYTGQTEPDKHNIILLEAQKWFRYSREDMQEVFDLAELPLEITRDSVIQNFALTKHSPKITRVLRKKDTKNGKV